MDRRPGDAVELVVDARATLGEGPVWDARARELIWVDILARMVHRFAPSDGSTRSLSLDRPVGAVSVRRAGGLVLALEGGFWLLDPDGRTPRPFAEVEADDPGNRMNDGKCDASGRFWAGTMAMDERPGAGALYRLDPGGEVTRVLEGVTISNGIDWSPDGRTMYYIDTPTHGVDAFDFDAATGALGRRRRIVDILEAEGSPDGMTVDAEGFLWVALWGGSAVRRYAPDGHQDAVVRLPVAQVTSCAFGGDDLRDLYITTASLDLGPEQLREQPGAGGVFRARPGVAGRPANTFAG